MANRRKDDRIHIRTKADLKRRFFAACDYRETDPSEAITRHMIAYVREAEKEMRERGIIPQPQTETPAE